MGAPLGNHISEGSLLNGGNSKVQSVLQLLLGYMHIYLKVGWPKMTTEDHGVVERHLRAFMQLQAHLDGFTSH